MNVLVVGGSGYVGGGVVDELLETTQHNVLVYDALLYEESYRKDVDFVYGDVRDTEKLSKYLNKADCVIWLAALVGDGACALNPEVTVQINQDSVQWLSENYDGRIIMMSTCSVYGAQEGILDENSKTAPLSVYAATKLKAESYLSKKNAVIFRLGTLFGVGDRYSRIRLDLVVNTMTARAFHDGTIHVYGGEQFRPLLHVYDVARAIKQNLDEDGFNGVAILNNQNVRIIDLAYQVRNHFPDLEIVTKDVPMQDCRSYRVNNNLATFELGFRPVYSIDGGIAQLKYLFEENRIKDWKSARYTNQKYLSLFNNELNI